jgi:hypothetical protein
MGEEGEAEHLDDKTGGDEGEPLRERGEQHQGGEYKHESREQQKAAD